jgi:hypothetical protein
MMSIRGSLYPFAHATEELEEATRVSCACSSRFNVVRNLGIEIDDALAIAEQVEV